MAASSRPSSDCYVVDEPLLPTIAAEIQTAIPDAEVRVADAVVDLGKPEEIGALFSGFQRYLYAPEAVAPSS